jgi:hypothetical protein
MKLLHKLFIALGVVAAVLIVLATCNYFLLWKPSLQGKCGSQSEYRSPAAARFHLAKLRGHVVGKNLSIVQYRWLRRRFKAIGATLSLVRELPSTEYEGNVVLNAEKVGDVVIGRSGAFDFGSLTPGMYDLTVTLPGEDAVGFGFVIDSSARDTDLLIDASPAHYCDCCGWNFELKSE